MKNKLLTTLHWISSHTCCLHYLRYSYQITNHSMIYILCTFSYHYHWSLSLINTTSIHFAHTCITVWFHFHIGQLVSGSLMYIHVHTLTRPREVTDWHCHSASGIDVHFSCNDDDNNDDDDFQGSIFSVYQSLRNVPINTSAHKIHQESLHHGPSLPWQTHSSMWNLFICADYG